MDAPSLNLEVHNVVLGAIQNYFWTCPLFRTGMSFLNQKRIANNVNPDETAHYEPSHLDLHCLRRVSVSVPVYRVERVNRVEQNCSKHFLFRDMILFMDFLCSGFRSPLSTSLCFIAVFVIICDSLCCFTDVVEGP